MNVEVSLDRLTRMVEEARAMPLSASCVVNRTEALELLDEIRAGLPSEITQASALLEDRESVLEAARGEAEELLNGARAHASALVSDSEIMRAARDEAAKLRQETQDDLDRERAETDEYIDARLAQFQVALQRTLETVDRARDRLGAPGGFGDEDFADRGDPLPEH